MRLCRQWSVRSETTVGGICGEAGGPPCCPGAVPFIRHTGTVDGGHRISVRRSGIDVRHKCCAECSIDNPMYSDGGQWPLKLNRHNIITVFISCLSGRAHSTVALHIDVWAHPVIQSSWDRGGRNPSGAPFLCIHNVQSLLLFGLIVRCPLWNRQGTDQCVLVDN